MREEPARIERPPRQPGTSRQDDRRERIFHAALEVFARRGFHQAQMDEVAREAGVGKGTIYRYVSDKEALLREAISHLVDVQSGIIRSRVDSVDDPLAKLHEYVHAEYSFMLRNKDLAKVVLAEQTALGHSPAFRASMFALHRRRKDLVTSIVQLGQERGSIRSDIDAEELAKAFLGVVNEFAFDTFFEQGGTLDPEDRKSVV